MIRTRLIAGVVVCSLLASVAVSLRAEEPVQNEQLRFFEQRIRPLLADRCYRCHGEEKQESNLRLDSWQGMRDGGASGRAVAPGDASSLLLAAISYQNPDLQMPPDGRLSDDEIADLTRWIESGAAHPGAVSEAVPTIDPVAAKIEAGRQHWAFLPLKSSPLPAVRNEFWPQSPIDYFVLAKLEEANLQPAPPADKLTLIRRATFDLIGVPPTYDEVRRFLQDESPDAFARLVDRLLASPQYGERWARHWLDVARYADSNGSDENIAHGNAWRYRDYVIRSFNRDKPYPQFVREQLAGDLLPTDDPAQRRERLTATAFLALGPKVLAEVDELKMEMDIIDEQVDTVTQALMGLTVGCARCHDHKFDPISTRDYYALAGIFKSTRTMENFTKIAKWWENEIALPDERQKYDQHEALIATARKGVDELVASATAELKQKLGEGAALPEKPEDQFPEETKAKLATLRGELSALETARVELPTSMGVSEGTSTNLAVCIRGSHLTPGDVVPRGIPQVLVNQQPVIPEAASGRLQFADWLTANDNPLAWRVITNRVWRWHFDRGIVATPDNFGRLGELPTHPELLDWLALYFQSSGGSLKQLHRMILLSSTYQMSSQWGAACAEHDADNSLLWRAPLRRLNAEVLRDSLLAVAGNLDGRMGGSMLHVKNREFFFDHTSIDKTNYATTRRSIYLPVVRNHLYDVFQLFDCTDAAVVSGNRASTTVPTQALFLMNGDIVQDASHSIANSVTATHPDAPARVSALYQRVYNREPTAEELHDALAFVAGHSAQNDGLSALAHVLLMSNEFLYLK